MKALALQCGTSSSLVVGGWWLVVGGWWLVVGCWLLVVGCWLWVVGCWLLFVVGCACGRGCGGRGWGGRRHGRRDCRGCCGCHGRSWSSLSLWSCPSSVLGGHSSWSFVLGGGSHPFAMVLLATLEQNVSYISSIREQTGMDPSWNNVS